MTDVAVASNDSDLRAPEKEVERMIIGIMTRATTRATESSGVVALPLSEYVPA